MTTTENLNRQIRKFESKLSTVRYQSAAYRSIMDRIADLNVQLVREIESAS
jgi:hypothetical protein